MKTIRSQDIPQQPQHQGPLREQLGELRGWAGRLGLYDAADWISSASSQGLPSEGIAPAVGAGDGDALVRARP